MGNQQTGNNKNKYGHTQPTTNKVETNPFTKEQMDYLLKLLDFNSSFDSILSVSTAQIGNNSIVVSFMLNSAPWIIDSGVSDHMSNSSHSYTTYSPHSSNATIRIVGRKIINKNLRKH